MRVQKHVPGVLAQADAFLLCSRNEAFGRVTAEAMFSAKAIIATNTGETPRLVEDETSGLLYEPGQIDRLMIQIRRLMDEPALRQSLGQRARARATEMFRSDRTVARLHRLLERIKGQPNPRSPRLLAFMERLASSRVLQLQQQLAEHIRIGEGLSEQLAEQERTAQIVKASLDSERAAVKLLSEQRTKELEAFKAVSAKLVERQAWRPSPPNWPSSSGRCTLPMPRSGPRMLASTS